MMVFTKQTKAFFGEYEKKFDAKFKPLNAEVYDCDINYSIDKITLDVILGVKYDRAIAATYGLVVCGQVILTENKTTKVKYKLSSKDAYHTAKSFKALLEIMEQGYDACLKDYMKVKQAHTLKAIERLPG